MGLRVNSNIAALGALRQLSVQDKAQSKSLERLSTGLRINRAADDPSGLVISEQLRAQTAGLKAAVRNSEFASNLVGTAEAALNQVSALLVDIRESVVFALNSGSLTTEQVAAEQASVDRALDAIDRISGSTRFGSKTLLDGSSAFQITSQSSAIDALSLRNVQFSNAESVTFRFSVTQVASRAMIRLASGGGTNGFGFAVKSTQRLVSGDGSAGTVKFRVTGNLGTVDVTLASGATLRDFMDQVNQNTQATGVYASAANNALVTVNGASSASFGMFSTGFGADQAVTLARVDVASGGKAYIVGSSTGPFSFGAMDTGVVTGQTNRLTPGQTITDKGKDIQVRIGSSPITGKGNKVTINTSFLTAELNFSQRYQTLGQLDKKGSPPNDTNALSGTAFTVLRNSNSGLSFQLGDSAQPGDRISVGIDSVRTADLGKRISAENTAGSSAANTGTLAGGFLSSVRTGGENDLFANARNALAIVDEAIAKVSGVRSALGSLQSNTIDPNVSSLNVAIENLTATESSIRDLDFAAQTSEFVKNQIMFQAATSVLASANLVPQAVLSLLQ
ncbi:MAG: hypothetical protein HY719_01665 [Planctomycetes bacterium]|nr:hypothetical protein [Planctomycetota bacterium]